MIHIILFIIIHSYYHIYLIYFVLIEDCRYILNYSNNVFDELIDLLEYWWNCKKNSLIYVETTRHNEWEKQCIELLKKQIESIDDAMTSIIGVIKQISPRRFKIEFTQKFKKEIEFAWKVNYEFVEAMYNPNQNHLQKLNKKLWRIFEYTELINKKSNHNQTKSLSSSSQAAASPIEQLLSAIKSENKSHTPLLTQIAQNSIHKIKNDASEYFNDYQQEVALEELMVSALVQLLQNNYDESKHKNFIYQSCRLYVIEACYKCGDCFNNYDPQFAQKIIEKTFINNLKYYY